jgi:hypothetical protein
MIARFVEGVILGAALAARRGPHDAEARAVIALQVERLTVRMGLIIEALSAGGVRS